MVLELEWKVLAHLQTVSFAFIEDLNGVRLGDH